MKIVILTELNIVSLTDVNHKRGKAQIPKLDKTSITKVFPNKNHTTNVAVIKLPAPYAIMVDPSAIQK